MEHGEQIQLKGRIITIELSPEYEALVKRHWPLVAGLMETALAIALRVLVVTSTIGADKVEEIIDRAGAEYTSEGLAKAVTEMVGPDFTQHLLEKFRRQEGDSV